MLFGQLDYISISFQQFNVLNNFFIFSFSLFFLYNYFIALYISQVSFYFGLVVRRQKRNRLGSFFYIFGAWSLYACCAIIIIIIFPQMVGCSTIFSTLWPSLPFEHCPLFCFRNQIRPLSNILPHRTKHHDITHFLVHTPRNDMHETVNKDEKWIGKYL